MRIYHKRLDPFLTPFSQKLFNNLSNANRICCNRMMYFLISSAPQKPFIARISTDLTCLLKHIISINIGWEIQDSNLIVAIKSITNAPSTSKIKAILLGGHLSSGISDSIQMPIDCTI